VKAELIDVELQRLGWHWAAVGELVINNLVAVRCIVYSVKSTSEEKRADVELKWLLQQVRRGELATVRLPITGEEFPTLLILSLSQRPREIVVIAFEMGEERLKRDSLWRE
jgi:hypothetical protein